VTEPFPKWGDPQILPKGVVRRPSAERMPFGPSGELRTPGPLREEQFMLAPDLAKLPQWVRRRGDEWTVPAFRALVLKWLSAYFAANKTWARKWQITEVATAMKSPNRLSDDRVYLRIRITSTANVHYETAAAFPAYAREDSPAQMNKVLAQAAASISAQRLA